MSNLLQRLTNFWREAGLMIRAGVNPTEIQTFESKYRVRLPDDLREYFLTIDGMEDDLDAGFNRFWPLEMVKPVHEELTDINPDRWAYPGCFLFADHCIWCFAWAVELRNESSKLSGPVFQVTGGDYPVQQIAPSFTAFMEMYLQNPFSIL